MKHLSFCIFLFLSLSVYTSSAQDLLDEVKDDSKLVHELKDVYRVFHIYHKIEEQIELINIDLNDEADDTDIDLLLRDFIKSCDSLRQYHFYDETLNSLMGNYITFTIESYKTAQTKGFTSTAFRKNLKTYDLEKGKCIHYVSSTYSTSHFVTLTEDTYWKLNDKNNYIKSTAYPRYKSMKNTNSLLALKLIDSIANHGAPTFQEYSIYKIEQADQYEKHNDTLGYQATEKALSIYKELLDWKQYSIYLFEAWVKWRVVTQQHIYGLSKDSDIPNNTYDKIREQVALTILKYVVKHNTDEMAINEFLLMATHDIVRRFGDYPYGNQNTVEYHQIFDNK